MRLRRLKTVAIPIAAVALGASGLMASGVTVAGAGVAPDPAATSPVWAQQHTLDVIADALAQQGEGAFADTYSNLYVDVPNGQVTLYVTSTSEGQQLIQAAKRAHPGIDSSRIKVTKAAYSKKAIDAQIKTIMASAPAQSASSETIYSVGEAPDGSGILVSVKPGTVSRMNTSLRRVTGIPVTVTAGSPISASTWRWNDTAPFIGGDVLVGNSVKSGYRDQCTSGIIAEGTYASNEGEDYVLTAAHCFPNGATVYGEGDTVGYFGFTFGNRIGKVIAVNPYYDTEVIDTGSSFGNGANSDEADKPQGNWAPVPEANDEHNGDYVCQDGARTYYTHGTVPCGIKITNDNITVNESWSDGSVHQVLSEQSTASYTAIDGDSGALVFTLCGGRCRDAAGQVSSRAGSYMYFVSESNILDKAFNPSLGVTQNPYT